MNIQSLSGGGYRVHFDEVVRIGIKKGKCLCGVTRTRRQKFVNTINPFNINDKGPRKGQPRTREEIGENLDAEVKKWESEPIRCDSCPTEPKKKGKR